ncbi:RNase H domain-containing protein [Colletotrichum nymphaeae SA-01]|uniref:ribonuclease H n=1 Tax=Colletotrichum nymphaeae SA-01 TaxID=1460502 RepID=A0A135SZH5_9PEZI|nr:RNase H domain-containing protein [Colletotrichum nymphaeae SA-01]
MAWPEIDRVIMPNGLELEDDDEDYLDEDEEDDDDELFGFDSNSHVPRDSADPEAPKQSAHVFQRTASNPLGERMQFSGTLFPTKFGQRKKKTPLSPEELFPPGRCMKLAPPALRFINRYDTSEALIYTDGACFGNGNAAARGGSAFIFKPVYANDQSGRVAFKLEDQGPDGKTYRHTSNRAELRAAVAALRYRAWSGEGFRSIVIATDSTYVVNGATDWARAWVKKGWRLSTGENVKNRDLWEALLLNVERLHDQSVSVRFWWIPRKFNHEADRAAKGAASIPAPRIEFGDLIGVRV